ncbi:hypothetical protein HFD88_005331 [Aspergillus terreus]|nr:hypothetical protein HFD88_005331 [Aspergillus terreus]
MRAVPNTVSLHVTVFFGCLSLLTSTLSSALLAYTGVHHGTLLPPLLKLSSPPMIAAVEALLSIFQSGNSSDPMKRPSCTGETSLRWFPRTYSRFGDGDGSAQLYTIIIGGAKAGACILERFSTASMVSSTSLGSLQMPRGRPTRPSKRPDHSLPYAGGMFNLWPTAK